MEYIFIIVIFLAELIVTYTLAKFCYKTSASIKELDTLVCEQKSQIYQLSRKWRYEVRKYNLKIKKIRKYENILNLDTLITILNGVATFLLFRKTFLKKY